MRRASAISASSSTLLSEHEVYLALDARFGSRGSPIFARTRWSSPRFDWVSLRAASIASSIRESASAKTSWMADYAAWLDCYRAFIGDPLAGPPQKPAPKPGLMLPSTERPVQQSSPAVTPKLNRTQAP